MKSGLYNIEITTSINCTGDISKGILMGNEGLVFLKLEPVSDEPIETEGCDYCRGRFHTTKPFKVITQLGKEVEVEFNFCPYCGAKIGSGDNNE